MGQAGAQREPSMEEILASIRKIIETNEKTGETGTSAATAGAEARHGGTSPTPEVNAPQTHAPEAQAHAPEVQVPEARISPRTPEPASEMQYTRVRPSVADTSSEPAAEAVRDEVAEFRTTPVVRNEPAGEEPGPKTAATERSQSDEAGPSSLADIAARMRGHRTIPVGTVLDDMVVSELRDMMGSNLNADETRAKASQDAADGLEEVAKELARIESEKKPTVQQPEADQSIHKNDEHKNVEASPEPDNEAEYSGKAKQAGFDAEPADETENVSQSDGERQLISTGAEEKVAQSFATLDAVMASGPQRDFDEIAEDLLRPMLQNWLDDNLPTLVERLVREEIERVSRGNRR